MDRGLKRMLSVLARGPLSLAARRAESASPIARAVKLDAPKVMHGPIENWVEIEAAACRMAAGI